MVLNQKTEKGSIPEISKTEIRQCLQRAADSPRRRYPKIIHKPGAQFNQVFNFMMGDTYMQPHLHPSDEKIEKMYLLEGSFAVLFFDGDGAINNISTLEKGVLDYIEIPAHTWHTYVMLSEKVVSYETMMGKFDPLSWKKLASWAPPEQTEESIDYLNYLKKASL